MSSYAECLASAVATHGVTGASFAYWDGATFHVAVAGLRNSVTADPMTADTVMHIGSITKVLNAVLLMQLVDEEKLALEDAVVKYLPELRLRDKNALKSITCGMLVNHTSGIDGDWLPDAGPDRERIVDAIDRCAELGQLFPPGNATSYCNIATVIAGYLTQKLRETSWYTLIRTRIYEPLGMRESLAETIDVPRFRCSIGDVTDPVTGAMVQTTRAFLSPSFAPAGSTLMTSARDLVTFTQALLNGGVGVNGLRILSASSSLRMTEPTAAFVTPLQHSGLGWMILPGGVLTHFGGGPGIASRLFAHPVSGRILVLLTNSDRGDMLRSAVLDPIVNSWIGHKNRTPNSNPDELAPTPYAGVYESNLQRVEVFAQGDRLAMRLTMKMKLYDNSPIETHGRESPAFVMWPIGKHSFEVGPMLPRGSKIEVSFIQPDTNGSMRFLATGARLLRRTK